MVSVWEHQTGTNRRCRLEREEQERRFGQGKEDEIEQGGRNRWYTGNIIREGTGGILKLGT